MSRKQSLRSVATFRAVLRLSVVVLPLSCFSLQAAEQEPTSQLASNLVNRVYQPLHNNFAASARQWALESDDLCERSPASSIYKMQTAFTQLIADYSVIELFRLGPLLENDVQHRLFFWPDGRRIVSRQLRATLSSTDIPTLSAKEFAQKSVAIQGVSALERLLFKSANLPVENEPQCHMAQLIIRNIAAMASELESGWQTHASFVKEMLSPSPDSTEFRNPDEVLRSLVTQISVGVDIILNRKLAPLISNDPATIRKAPLWISQRTVTMLRGNLTGIESLVLQSGLITDKKLIGELRYEFNYVDSLLGKLKNNRKLADEEGQLYEEEALTLRTLHAVVSGIEYKIKDRVFRPLGIGVGFNSEDGD